jgi:hypothetical protein
MLFYTFFNHLESLPVNCYHMISNLICKSPFAESGDHNARRCQLQQKMVHQQQEVSFAVFACIGQLACVSPSWIGRMKNGLIAHQSARSIFCVFSWIGQLVNFFPSWIGSMKNGLLVVWWVAVDGFFN